MKKKVNGKYTNEQLLKDFSPMKRFEFTNDSHTPFVIGIATTGSYDNDCKTNTIRLGLWKYAIWFTIPEIIKPKKKWVETNMLKHPTATSPGYFENIPKRYEVSLFSGDLHVSYGIQPGSWQKDDKDNSDHTKVFRFPWHLQHVRWSVYNTDGTFVVSGDEFSKWESTWKYRGPKGSTSCNHTWVNNVCSECNCEYDNKDSLENMRYDIFTNVPQFNNNDMYNIYRYVDKHDGEETIARVHIAEREWIRGKWKWLRATLKYIPGCRLIHRCLEIEFYREMGPRKGSWKGGTIAMSFGMNENESMDHAFERFQLEGRV